MNANAAANPAPQIPVAPVQPVAPAPPIQPHAAAPAAANAVPAQPVRHPRAPRPVAPKATGTVNSVPEMYKLVASSPSSTIERLGLNTFIPSCIAMYQVISQMNHMMETTDRFTRSASDWHPFLSLAYFGVAFIVQTLRCYEQVAPLPHHEKWILDSFVDNIGLDSILIPGPLVPFFQALAACSSPYEWYGNIAPTVIGITAGCNQANDYVLANGLTRTFPNIPMYIDALARVSALDTEAAAAVRREIMRTFYRSIMQVDAANANSDIFHMHSAGLPARPFATTGRISTVDALLNLDLPARLNRAGADATDLNLSQFMRLFDAPTVANARYHTWFEQAAGIMTRYGQFFKDSVPLSAITPTGIGAAICQVTYSANNLSLNHPYVYHPAVAAAAGVAAQRAYYSRTEPTSLNASMQHIDPALEEQAEQCAQLAQVNVSTITLGWAAPTNATLRQGDIWNLTNIRRTQDYDIAPGIYARLASSYHTDTRNTN